MIVLTIVTRNSVEKCSEEGAKRTDVNYIQRELPFSVCNRTDSIPQRFSGNGKHSDASYFHLESSFNWNVDFIDFRFEFAR